ncbi:MAG: hypothetical protein V3V00_12375, partial [Saprospiraceae bacterium]
MDSIFKISLISFILSISVSFQVKADHIWGARNLQAIESPAGSGEFKIDFEFYYRKYYTSNKFQWELYVVEEGCAAADGFTATFTGCTDVSSGVNEQWNDGTLATGLKLCSGKTYNIILYTRRRGNEGNVQPCGTNENRAGAADPRGELVKHPGIGAGDPNNIWSGTPINIYGDTPTFDGNWAYLINTLAVPGNRIFQMMADFVVDDCYGAVNQSVNISSANNDPLIQTTTLPMATVRCGSDINITYNSDNSCGPGYPGNTFQIDNASTVGGFDPSSGAVNTAMGPGLNVAGRFETLVNAMASGHTCSSGKVEFEFVDADCNPENEIMQKVSMDITVVYPSSKFEAPLRVNCSDVCGQELIIPSSAVNPQWQANGINMGVSTTLPSLGLTNMTFDFTGQVCNVNLMEVDCDQGSGTAKVDNCASCGVYDISYAIADTNCPDCLTSTTQQVEIVSGVISNVMATETSSCEAFVPDLSFTVVECDPVTGAPTGTPYTGNGTKLWERNDMPGVMIPENSTNLEVLEGQTVIFTPHYVNDDCAACSTSGMPITISVFGNADDPTNSNTTMDICEGDPVTLSATCPTCNDGSTPIVNWYPNATGGMPIFVGADFTPVSGISSSQQGIYDNTSAGLYTFFAECVCNDCPSNRLPYSINVVDLPVDPSPVNLDFTCVTNTNGLIPLSTLFPGVDMTPANFTPNGANPANIQGGAIIYNGPGCYCADYNFDNGTCPPVGPITSCVSVSEMPQPAFNIQNPICFTTGQPNPTATPILNSPNYISPVIRTWSLTGPGTIDPVTGMVTFTGVGTVDVNLTEVIDYPACGTNPAGMCTATTMHSVSVETGENLNPSFTISNLEPCINDIVTLLPSEVGGIFSGTGVTDNGDGSGGTFTTTACGDFDITYTRSSPNGCLNVLTQTISTDKTAPMVVTPSDITVECDGLGNTNDITSFEAGFSVTDNCNIASSALTTLSNITTCGNTFVKTYQYTATDDCNNITTKYATITVEDNTLPVITPSNNMPTMVECDGGGNSADLQAFLNNNGGLTNADVIEACGIFTWNYNFNGSSSMDPACANNVREVYSVAFYVVDECGNESAPIDRMLQIKDTTPPSITAPNDITLECNDGNNSAVVQNFIQSLFTADICDNNLTVTNDYNTIPDCGTTSTVTFTVEDGCGNMAMTTSKITVEDT